MCDHDRVRAYLPTLFQLAACGRVGFDAATDGLVTDGRNSDAPADALVIQPPRFVQHIASTTGAATAAAAARRCRRCP
jgi:hypothetical protein